MFQNKMLRRVALSEVKANVIDAVDAVTRSQSQAIIDEVREGGKAGFIKVARRLGDLESGRSLICFSVTSNCYHR